MYYQAAESMDSDRVLFGCPMGNQNNNQKKLFKLIHDKWERLMINDFEDWLASLGILWVDDASESIDGRVRQCLEDGPKGAVVVWCPGFWPRKNQDFKRCWVIPEDVALKLLVLG